ncbi:helix-turn-helix transcriptional regulator [Acholeplasma hippikon]|uniref:Multiple antibiotic resistance protein marA n=1 Tax=Acholeplasma hippikon TaxID=264636 RepID=A0A449BIW3_9MOLU|nr:AraC family transcriptional regulator [Acholeplasma hippikon]VEU82399.1 Multiple antibiotic resistance protein marA [Acholeplasma hippikon]
MGDTIKNLVKFIEENILEDLSIKNLESNFNYSERHIRRVFKNQTNVSIHPYITQRKMTYALFDLKTNIESVKDLYLKYGYNSHDSFSRAFKRTFNVSPKNYQKINTTITLKEITPHALAPLIEFQNEDHSLYKFEHLYWEENKNKNKLTPIILDIDNYGSSSIEKVIQYGFSPLNIYKLSANDIGRIELNKYIDTIVTKRNINQNTNIMFIVYADSVTDCVKLLIDTIINKNQMLLIVNESNKELADIDRLLYHLTVSFNRSTVIKLEQLKKVFYPTPTFVKAYTFDSYASIFDTNFINEIGRFEHIVASIACNHIIDVNLLASIINHINDKNKVKITVIPSYSKIQEKPFEIMIYAK